MEAAEFATGKTERVLVELARWPDSLEPTGKEAEVDIVSVNHNTRDLVALLLYSIWRVLRSAVVEVVIVDNGSTDGSLELLTGAARAGLCTLLANDENAYHGPALNQALSYLAGRAAAAGSGPDWVWILDSDCVVSRPDALRKAIVAAKATHAALLGEYQWDRWHGVDRFGIHCVLIDPASVWRDGLSTFDDDGDPSFAFFRSASEAGLVCAAFPFLADAYVIHRGRGSLAWVATNEDRSNRYYNWALGHHEPHFGNVAGAASRYQALWQEFQLAVPRRTAADLIAACLRR